VRFRDTGVIHEEGRPEAVIEAVLPRRTILTRSDSFKSDEQHPIVANADQMLIVVSLREPKVKWGLIDRMLIAARAGGLAPIVCLNKIDLADTASEQDKGLDPLAHYATLSIRILRTSVPNNVGIDELANLLKNRVTVLAGHSGVGKSSLIRAIEPDLDIRIGEISGYTGKGRHTTTSARTYPLTIGGLVIDTPGVKLFGLWNVTRENLLEYFPDVEAKNAPEWRQESYQRILDSILG
jgi:ribosome biogenesis GTPase